MQKTFIFFLFSCSFFSMAFFSKNSQTMVVEEAPLLKLSDYGFFNGSLKNLEPKTGILPYEVNAPLFSDYAEKLRFIALPDGKKMVYNPDSAFIFPEGSHLIKNFFYSIETGRRLIETRILKKTSRSWKAYTYVWNTEQTEAILEVAGATIPVERLDENGKKQRFDYYVPNLNQCKGCHSQHGQFVPIGLTARQLNRNHTELNINQLQVFFGKSFDSQTAPKMPDYRDKTATLNLRARAYLDANCAYCHNEAGPASTSGLLLNFFDGSSEHLGINKAPVAAGRGSGGRKFGIAPGSPKESILLYRMESTDTGIRMPEIGRSLVDEVGVELIREWILEMK